MRFYFFNFIPNRQKISHKFISIWINLIRVHISTCTCIVKKNKHKSYCRFKNAHNEEKYSINKTLVSGTDEWDQMARLIWYASILEVHSETLLTWRCKVHVYWSIGMKTEALTCWITVLYAVTIVSDKHIFISSLIYDNDK